MHSMLENRVNSRIIFYLGGKTLSEAMMTFCRKDKLG